MITCGRGASLPEPYVRDQIAIGQAPLSALDSCEVAGVFGQNHVSLASVSDVWFLTVCMCGRLCECVSVCVHVCEDSACG